MPHLQTASYCAWRVCQFVGLSRSVVLFAYGVATPEGVAALVDACSTAQVKA